MPQNGMNYEGKGRGTWRYTCKANDQAASTGWVNGAVVHNGYPAATTRSITVRPPSTLNKTNPPCVVNRDINHSKKGKSRKAMQPRTLWQQRSTSSAVSDASAADRVSSAVIPGGISVNGAAALGIVAVSSNSDQLSREPFLLAASKKKRRVKKFARKKRPPLMPHQEEEDWENEIEEVTILLPDLNKMCSRVKPYGPEDVLHFALQDLSFKETDAVALPVTANYRPAVHHPLPVQWLCCSVPTEPDQFADADE